MTEDPCTPRLRTRTLAPVPRPLAPATVSDLRARLDDALGDRYSVTELVGEGGMSFVFAATDVKHRRLVAIKVLKPELAAALGAERFLREIEIAAGCTHPNILPLHDSGSADGLTYFVMPLVDGPSLRDRLDEGPVPLEEAVRISGQVATALAYAHRQGLVHRDVKPENVLFVAGQATVTDFGVARALSRAGESGRLTRTGMAIGTVAYMSPEQATGEEEVDGRTDQYALACIVWEMISGESLHDGLTPRQVFARRLTGSPVPDEGGVVPASVRAVLARGTASDPQDRFDTLDAFQSALEQAATQLEIARADARGARRVRARRAAWVVAAVGVVAAGVWIRGAAAEPTYDRLAVLPFENAGLPDDAFFVEGMHESLIGELQQAGLSVIGRRSVMRFAEDATASIRDIADQLGTDAILEGDAYRGVDSVGITVRLLDGSTDLQVWQADFAAPASRITALYREIAGALAEEIGLELDAPARRRLAQEVVVDPAAYEAFVRGRFHWNRLTPAELDLAEQNFRRALSIDPEYADAHAGLASVAAGRQQMGLLQASEAVPQWESSIRAALVADSLNAYAWGVQGGLEAWAYWDWEAALTSMRRSLELNPSQALGRAYYAHVLMITGRPEEALREADQALEDDPLNTLVGALRCVVQSMLADIAVAEEGCRAALEQESTNPVAIGGSGHLLVRRSDWDGYAENVAAEAAATGAAELARVIREALPQGGRVALRRGGEFLETAAETGFVPPSRIIEVYAGSDRPERALPWIPRAVALRDPNVTYMGVLPYPPEITGSPEMADLLEAVGIDDRNRPGG